MDRKEYTGKKALAKLKSRRLRKQQDTVLIRGTVLLAE
jgi:hypothetical protein